MLRLTAHMYYLTVTSRLQIAYITVNWDKMGERSSYCANVEHCKEQKTNLEISKVIGRMYYSRGEIQWLSNIKRTWVFLSLRQGMVPVSYMLIVTPSNIPASTFRDSDVHTLPPVSVFPESVNSLPQVKNLHGSRMDHLVLSVLSR